MRHIIAIEKKKFLLNKTKTKKKKKGERKDMSESRKRKARFVHVIIEWLGVNLWININAH